MQENSLFPRRIISAAKKKNNAGVKDMLKHKISSTIAVMLLVAVLSGTTAYGFSQADGYRRQLQYNYRRSLQDLSDHVGNIETVLDKAAYANTPTEQNGLAAKLQREAGMAKTSLAALPVNDNSLNNVSKFITQVGDFSATLSRNISAGGKITSGDFRTIGNLKSYSQKLSTDIQSVNVDFSSASSFHDAIKETAKDFSDFPSLIYDGPFADHVVNQKPKLTSGKGQILQGNAQNIAAEFLNTSQSYLAHVQDTAGNLPTYNFTANGRQISIAVTKAGGYIAEMANSRSVDTSSLGYKEASQKAHAFLESRGIRNMKESYYVIADNVCLLNFASVQDGVLCYPDLIKVGVALDNGEIIRFQSTGYLMNHCERKLTLKLTAAEAQKSVSPNLSVKNCKPALIPTKTGGEALTYEFLCSGSQNDRVLVYIDASTGYEDDILIIRQSDQGVLVK